MKRLLENAVIARILFLVLSFAIMMVVVTWSSITDKNKREAKAVSIETSTACINEMDTDLHLDFTDNIPRSAIEDTESIDLKSAGEDYFEILLNDLNNLKNGDDKTVTNYFGTSDVFTPEVIADRVSVTTMSLIDYSVDELGNNVVNTHICTINYDLMNSDYTQVEAEQKEIYDAEVSKGNNPELSYTDSAKKIIAANLIEGKYNVCYNIPVTIIDNAVVVSESIKQAITGGWYNGVGVELTPAKCIVK